ncbi:hypothetical protein GGX14DRAFT_557902 [Mycena pura]|uniref:Uncharacterized protein n=1 Tax=Mycena pura TaxID=153505 RepID=A0AAD7E162_9AGAR|nr:hypothetical protein GGX14DRAFT_557902 [Mycena pura]
MPPAASRLSPAPYTAPALATRGRDTSRKTHSTAAHSMHAARRTIPGTPGPYSVPSRARPRALELLRHGMLALEVQLWRGVFDYERQQGIRTCGGIHMRRPWEHPSSRSAPRAAGRVRQLAWVVRMLEELCARAMRHRCVLSTMAPLAQLEISAALRVLRRCVHHARHRDGCTRMISLRPRVHYARHAPSLCARRWRTRGARACSASAAAACTTRHRCALSMTMAHGARGARACSVSAAAACTMRAIGARSDRCTRMIFLRHLLGPRRALRPPPPRALLSTMARAVHAHALHPPPLHATHALRLPPPRAPRAPSVPAAMGALRALDDGARGARA